MTENKKQVKSKEFEPGWNDPPLFSYESHEAHCRQSKNVPLNKRVVFPISSCADNPNVENRSESILSSRISSTSPPKFPSGGPPRIATLPSEISPTAPEQQCNDNADIPSLDVLLKNFSDILQQVYGQEDDKEGEEIKRRLAVMEKMWNEGKFNTLVQEKLFKLSLALKEDRLEDCESLQRNLMVDHSNVCSLWMAAVRKLIYCKKESPNTSNKSC
uniref:Putative steroid receptor rna activator n=1 Tax=Panstrongylus megistus TaxID=65343 RepID=A0A069DQ70_9HEMI